VIILHTKKEKWQLPVAVNEKGDIVHTFDYDGWPFSEGFANDKKEFTHKLIDNIIFKATLLPEGFSRGRSAVHYYFKDAASGTVFNMKGAKVEELLKAIAKGEVQILDRGFRSTWTFFKQGQNFSIGLWRKK
jgi:hypothetical protein